MPSEGDYLEGMIVNGPRRQDVASTRDHKWHTHEQNVFYRELVHKAVTNMKTFDAESFKNAADRIVNIILIDKQGVFVKDYATGWIVMSRKETHNKVQQALRNYQRKLEGYNRPQKRKQSSKKKFPVTAKKRILQAQGGTEASIHPYALLLISAVCNKHEPLDALRVLDNPLSQCFTDGEPPKERTMRLQVSSLLSDCIVVALSNLLVAKGDVDLTHRVCACLCSFDSDMQERFPWALLPLPFLSGFLSYGVGR